MLSNITNNNNKWQRGLEEFGQLMDESMALMITVVSLVYTYPQTQ